MLMKMIAMGLAAGALALLALGWSSGAVGAQQPDLLFDFKPEDVVRFQINEIGRPPLIFTRPSLAAPWQFNAATLSVEKAAEITATLKIIQTLSPTTPSEIRVVTPTTEVQITTDNRTEYVLRIGRRITDTRSFLIEQSRKSAGATDWRSYVATDQEMEKLQTQLGGLVRLVQEPTRTPVLPTPTATPKPTATFTITPSPTSAPSSTIAPAPTEIPTPTPAPTPEITNPLEKFALITQTPLWLVIAGGVSCLVVLIALVGLLILFWLRHKRGAPPLATPFLELESTGLRMYLKRDALTLGRGADCDLRIAENLPGADTVSHQHARFVKRDARWIVVDGVTDDQPSTNGIYVNGKRTLENYLYEGDEVTFGELKFRFHIPTTGLPISQGDAR